MEYGSENIYKLARANTEYSQADVAGFLNKSPDTISNWETYKCQPDDVDVMAMAKLYKTPWLVIQHIKICTRFGEVFPNIKIDDLRTAALDMIDTQAAWGDLQSLMVRVCRDGVIKPDEKPDWKRIEQQALAVAGAALSLYFSAKE